ncbi:VOC family protein [Paenibacillus sp. P36]|uniref:VOC family protein n=1 Tax=Paenibacillus sp. P36 TaxID=3342538 RepID=UPI0038B27EF9
MEYREFGLILFVERYDECVTFYREVLNLPVRNVKSSLVCFNLPHGYLMVEQGGVGETKEKLRTQNPTVIRFDVDSLLPIVCKLEERGVKFIERKLSYSWGSIAVLKDPDGNRIELGELNNTSASYKIECNH